MELAAGGLVVDMTGRCDEEFLRGVEIHRLFAGIAAAVLEPADHPVVNGLPGFEWRAVRSAADEVAQLVFGPVERKPAAGFVIDEPGAGGREIVTLRGEDEPGHGRGQLDVV